jgi:hypothetical protein
VRDAHTYFNPVIAYVPSSLNQKLRNGGMSMKRYMRSWYGVRGRQWLLGVKPLGVQL